MARINVPISVDAREAKKEIREFNAEMSHVGHVAKVTANALSDNGDHLEALAVEHQALIKQIKLQNDISEKNRVGLEASDKQMSEYKNRLEEAKGALESLKITFGENSKAVEDMEKNVGHISMEYSLAQKRVVEWNRALEKSEAAELNLQSSLNKTSRELVNTANAVDEYSKNTDQATGKTITFWQVVGGSIVADFAANALKSMASGMLGYVNAGAQLAQEAIESQGKLTQVMRNTMNATQAQIDTINALTTAQQQIGVVSQTTQTAGAQELATYLEKTETLQKLIPVMNDMVVQQHGINASQQGAVSIATMLGKVMDGQVGALSRYGYSVDEVQAKILKTGTEAERAAALLDVISASVGGMNEALAKTDAGKQARLNFILNDTKQQIGEIYTAMKAELGADALPAVEEMSRSLLKLVEDNKGNIQNLLNILQGLFSFVINNHKTVSAGILSIGAGFGAMKVADKINDIKAWMAKVSEAAAAQAIDTAATAANTTAKLANAGATDLQATAGVKNAAVTGADTTATNINTGAKTANAIAIGAVTKAMLASPLFIGAIAVMAIAGIVKAVDYLTSGYERQAKKVQELTDEYKRLQGEVEDTERKLENVGNRLNELFDIAEQRDLTIVEQDELDKLEEANEKLRVQLELRQALAFDAAKNAEGEALDALNHKNNPLRLLELYIEEYERVEKKAEAIKRTQEFYVPGKSYYRIAQKQLDNLPSLESINEDINKNLQKLQALSGGITGVTEEGRVMEERINTAFEKTINHFNRINGIEPVAQQIQNIIEDAEETTVRIKTASQQAAGSLLSLIEAYNSGETSSKDYVAALQKQLYEIKAIIALNPALADSYQPIIDMLQSQLSKSPEYLKILQTTTSGLSKDVDMLRGALDEQRTAGELNEATILKLIDAGYALALEIDAETGAVTLNAEAYMHLMESKLEVHRADLEMAHSNITSGLERQREAVHNLTESTYGMAQAKLQAARALEIAEDAAKEELAALDKQIAVIERLRAKLDAPLNRSGGRSTPNNNTAQLAEREAEAERKARVDAWAALYKDEEAHEKQRLDRKKFYNQLSLEEEAAANDAMLENLRKALAEVEALTEATEEEKAKIRSDLAGRMDTYERQAYTLQRRMTEEAIKDAADASTRVERNLQKVVDSAADAAEKYEAYAQLRLAVEQRLQNALARVGDKFWLNEKQKLAEVTAAYDAFDKEMDSINKKMNDLQAKQADEVRREEEKAYAERLKAHEKFQADRLEAARKASQEEIALIRAKADAAVSEAQRAADAEIAIINDKIKAIDAILKAEARQETEADEDDRLLRLRTQLEYETSDDNKYNLQKEITRIEAERVKRQRRESLEDEKETLRQQINMVRDSLAQRKAAIEEQRDLEIKANQEALASYEKRLETETALLAQKLTDDTDMINDENDTRLVNNQKFLTEVKKQDERHSREKRQLFSRTTDQILSDLFSRVNNFYSAGWQSGNAFAAGYKDATAALAGYSGMAGHSGVASASYNIELTQNFNTPTPSPSQIAKETQYTLEDLLRYG
jgi:hypothetical protein